MQLNKNGSLAWENVIYMKNLYTDLALHTLYIDNISIRDIMTWYGDVRSTVN
jgi:hypothetical protein